MNGFRWLLAAVLMALVGLPLVLPLGECLTQGDPAGLWAEREYLGRLAWNTFLLLAGTLALSMPLGILGAVLLFRTDLPLRRFWIGATVLVIFIPLPLLASAWYSFLGRDGWCPLPGWEINLSRAWTTGLVPAILLHSMAGLPWVVLIVGNGLSWVEKELEEEALVYVGPWRVFWSVTLPHSRTSVLAGALWLGLTTLGEISVTFFLQVPTFAEQIQVQFSSGNPQALAQNVLLSLPVVLPLGCLLFWLLPRLEKSLPPLQSWLAPPRLFRLGPWRRPLGGVMAIVGLAVLLFPLAGLVWKVGLTGTPASWSLEQAWTRYYTEGRVAWKQVALTMLTSLGTAFLTGVLALVGCWLAQANRWFRVLVLGLVTLCWVLPGPVIGLGLKEWINVIIEVPLDPFMFLLYQGPSPIPIMWAHLIRIFPVAMALLWPWVRMVPRELLEEARLAGAGPFQELCRVIWPLVAPGFRWTLLVLTALCLGEVAASNLVETPGWITFTKLLLDRMHYSVDSTVAALSLLLLGCLMMVLGFGILVSKLLASERNR